VPKRIRDYEDIYIAPEIVGKFRDGNYLAEDERNNHAILNPTDTNHKILIYERQVFGWFLDRATRYASNGKYNGFIVLMLCDEALFEQLVEHIRANGYEGKFYSKNITYYDEDGVTYWTMGAPLDETVIVNRCSKENTYEYRLKSGTLPN